MPPQNPRTLTDTHEFDATARWIGRDNPVPPPPPGEQPAAPLLRRDFRLPCPPEHAELHIAALGYHHTEINGRAVSDALLDPPPSQYDRTAFSRTIDVTELLHEGENALGVMLGRAYVSGVGGPEAVWTSEPRLLAQLDITLPGGETLRIVSDDAWRMADGPVRDWLFLGEHHDARAEKPGWTTPSYDTSSWSAAPQQPVPTRRVVPALMPPVRIADTFGPVAQTQSQADTRVYDFGRITAGWTRITVEGERGTTVTLTYGQTLNDDGTVYTWLPNMHIDSYTLSGEGPEVWEPRFVRHGFQYVEVSFSDHTGAPLDHVGSFRIEARENHTALEPTGTFASGNPLLNRIHDNQRRSLLLNHWGFPTDTSWRDRQGWTADTALFMDGAILNFADVAEVYDRFLLSLRDARLPDGSTPVYAPFGREVQLYDDPSWSGMLVLMPWTLYQHYGESKYLRDNYEAMVVWMDRMDALILKSGDLYDGYSFGDHSSPGSEDAGTVALSPPEGGAVTANGHLFLQARTLARIARLLDRPEDAPRFEAMADRIATAFNAAYFDTAENVYRTPAQQGYRQTSNLVPLAFGLVPAGHEDAVLANLVADLTARGHRLNTGAIGTKLLLPVLTEHGLGDLAYRVAAQTEYPSWGHWVEQGATASWETWSHRGSEQSLDHPFLGTVEDWFFRHLAGIQAATPGYGEVRIAPVFPADLDHASASVLTPHGRVSSSWLRDEDRLTLTVDVPAGLPTEIRLPFPESAVEVVQGQATPADTRDGRTDYRTSSARTVLRVR
ncbi:family 78 glycoside hydrolase catalytic domain [Streptomyces sp. NPDC002680]|uniref:family 78 glycoside hydrolase catalytic domain n=1 Tax=Streptomyces sp. NPDC002680 TaxID=3364659 RepID=UPI0036A2B849